MFPRILLPHHLLILHPHHILDALCNVLRHDAKVRPDAFTEQFTPEQFAGILFSLMLSAVVQQSFDPSAVLEIVRRTIY